MPVKLEIRQWEHYEGEDWWRWAVWLEGRDEALDAVDSVEWTLHPTFPNPVRVSRDRATKFRIETGGWGVFTITARVQLKDAGRLTLRHPLELHYPDGSKTTS